MPTTNAANRDVPERFREWPYNLIFVLTDDEEKTADAYSGGLNEALNTLGFREYRILHMYYAEGTTLNRIAEHFKITREHARQIMEEAKCKLRKSGVLDLVLAMPDTRVAKLKARIRQLRNEQAALLAECNAMEKAAKISVKKRNC